MLDNSTQPASQQMTDTEKLEYLVVRHASFEARLKQETGWDSIYVSIMISRLPEEIVELALFNGYRANSVEMTDGKMITTAESHPASVISGVTLCSEPKD